MQITVKADTVVALVGDKPIDLAASYNVATSDYLSQGNDGMEPLKNSTHTWKSDRKIRDLYIEHIELNKVVEAHVDGRFVIEK
jgi:2',3'-cyclic-nucleotide 2'-phosphodiesterase (5'-nucleotidase family)